MTLRMLIGLAATLVSAAACSVVGLGLTSQQADRVPQPKTLLLLQPAWAAPESNAIVLADVRRTATLAGYDESRLHIATQVVPFEPAASAAGAIRDALVRVQPEVVLTQTIGAALRYREFGASGPLVFSGSSDPVATCLVDSMLRPGRAVSGYTSDTTVSGKLVEVLRDAYPRARRVTVLIDANVYPDNFACGTDAAQLEQARAAQTIGCAAGILADRPQLDLIVDVDNYKHAADRAGLSLTFERVCRSEDLTAFAEAWPGGDDAAVIVPNRLLTQQSTRLLVDAFNARGIPVVYETARYAEAGGVVALGPRNQGRALQQATEMALLALEGEPLHEMPVRTPSGLAVWVNLRTAQRTAVRPSVELVRRADVLIR